MYVLLNTRSKNKRNQGWQYKVATKIMRNKVLFYYLSISTGTASSWTIFCLVTFCLSPNVPVLSDDWSHESHRLCRKVWNVEHEKRKLSQKTPNRELTKARLFRKLNGEQLCEEHRASIDLQALFSWQNKKTTCTKFHVELVSFRGGNLEQKKSDAI